jgi:hypothetical protein
MNYELIALQKKTQNTQTHGLLLSTNTWGGWPTHLYKGLFRRAPTAEKSQSESQIHLDPPWIYDLSKCLVQLDLQLYPTAT